MLVLSTQAFSQIHISGELNGTLTDTTYIVDDDAYINSSLTIEPGAVLRFEDGAQFDIYGLLVAEGTVEDTIYFILNDGAEAWGGIDLNLNSSALCRLSYCYISGSNSCGILCWDAEPYRISHCVITNNSASDPDQETNIGGGIYWFVSFGVEGIRNCTISNNEDCGIYIDMIGNATLDSLTITGNSDGGIVICESYLTMSNSIISNNVADTSNVRRAGGLSLAEDAGGFTLLNSEVSNNSGYTGGIYSDVGITCVNSSILNNSSEARIGGINVDYGTFSGCIISGNSGAYCGGILTRSDIVLDHCTVAQNISYSNSSNVIMYFNYNIITNNIFSFNHGNGLYIGNGDNYNDIRNNLFFGNTPYNFRYSEDYDTVGVLSTTNSNGDSCDHYYNLFLDPMFADTGAGDYSLTEESPCIDAGTPDSTYDPDNTITDIGAIYFNQAEVPHNQQSESPETFRVSPAYPNPFNAVTRLRIDVPYTSSVHVSVFDILGRQVLVLKEDVHSCGVHELVIDGSSLSSGTYFVSIAFDERQQRTSKIVLLK